MRDNTYMTEDQTKPIIDDEITPSIAGPDIKPPEPSAAPVQAPHKKKIQLKIFVPVFLMMGIIAGILIMGDSLSNKPVIIPTPTPTEKPLPTPTPNRIQSAVASTSAFLTIDRMAASLSATLDNLKMNDTSLNPPTIEIPLGFPNL